MRLITLERAKRDIEDIARYIALDRSQSAEDCRKACNNACELLLHTPEMGPHRGSYNPALDDLRMMRLHNFTNYLIVYRPPRENKASSFVSYTARGIFRRFLSDEEHQGEISNAEGDRWQVVARYGSTHTESEAPWLMVADTRTASHAARLAEKAAACAPMRKYSSPIVNANNPGDRITSGWRSNN
jgi:plasmid stabilization system protein ParE